MLLAFCEQQGVDVGVNKACADGRTPLHAVCYKGSEAHLSILHALVAAGADQRYARRGGDGLTPLQISAKWGKMRMLGALLSLSGEDVVNAQVQRKDLAAGRSGAGATALYLASERGNVRCCELLLSHPTVDLHLAREDGLTPLAIARRKNNEEVRVDSLVCSASG